MLLLILYQNENHKYCCSVTEDTMLRQWKKHEKDIFTIWLDNKTKIETRLFKTLFCFWYTDTQCCISATLTAEVATKFSQNCTVEIRDKITLLSTAAWLTWMKKEDWCAWFPETLSVAVGNTCLYVCFNKCLEICTENKKNFDQKIAHFLLCKELYREVLNLQKQLKKVSEGFNRLQVDDTTATALVEMWFDLITTKN